MYDREWATPHFSYSPTERPILGAIWHDTETFNAVPCHANGSWHYQIDRDGEIIRHVAEHYIAWGAAGVPTRLRPAWAVDPPPSLRVSALNWSGVHVELVSNAEHRAAGEPYTQAQYDAAIRLTRDLEHRHGPVWHIGHGECQTDRSDPVLWDWERAGFGPFDGVNGRAFVAREQQDDETEIPDVSKLNDQQAEAAATALWQQRGQTFVPGFALSDAWLARWREGKYAGLPQTPEIDLPDGAKVQAFDLAAAAWEPSTGVSWEA